MWVRWASSALSEQTNIHMKKGIVFPCIALILLDCSVSVKYPDWMEKDRGDTKTASIQTRIQVQSKTFHVKSYKIKFRISPFNVWTTCWSSSTGLNPLKEQNNWSLKHVKHINIEPYDAYIRNQPHLDLWVRKLSRGLKCNFTKKIKTGGILWLESIYWKDGVDSLQSRFQGSKFIITAKRH